MHRKLKRFANVGCLTTFIVEAALLVGLSAATKEYAEVGTAEMLNRALVILVTAAFTLGIMAVFTALQFIVSKEEFV